MIAPAAVLSASFGYLLLLFGIAAFGDRRAAQGRSVINNSFIYALSWGVYCTAWTYYGSIGRAVSGGVWFLPIYLGPMLAMLVAWLVIRKMVRIARAYRITSIADFIASRYGKSPLLAALVTVITVIGILPYIALQLKAVSAGYDVLTAGSHQVVSGGFWIDGTFYIALLMAVFTTIFGTRHLDLSERHEGMVAAVAFESAVKLVAFLLVGIFVCWGLFAGPADLWDKAQQLPEISGMMRLESAGRFNAAGWVTMIVLAMLSVLLLPRQFQVMVVECIDERHIRRAAWIFPLYMLLINIFVLPIAIAGMLIFGAGQANPDTFVLTLPATQGARWLALVVYVGGLSAVTGMLIVETVAISTMVCNDLVMPALLRSKGFAARSGRDLTGLLLNIRRVGIVVILMLGYLYFRIAGEAYALVAIGLISFAAVAQFAPALFGGMYWRGGTWAGAVAGLIGGALVWAYTLMLPSIAKSGWIGAGFIEDGPFGLRWLAPEALFGMRGLDYLTHSLFWSMLVNIGLYVGISLMRSPSAREASQAQLFVDAFHTNAEAPVFWRGRARLSDLQALATRFLGPERADTLFDERAAQLGVAPSALIPDARLVDRIERQIAGAVGTASARVIMGSVVQEEALTIADVVDILEEASQVRIYARELEEKSAKLQIATQELRAANEELKSLDQLKDDFMSSVTHELRTPLTSIRAFAELMLDTPDMDDPEREEFLRIILTESERLGRLVNQVLDLARIEAGMAEWNTAEVDLRALVADSVRTTSELFRDKGVQVVSDLPAHVPLIQADPDRLMQVMVNLLSNAAKFAPKDVGRVTVTLRCDDSGLTVQVCDNGPGVAPEEQAAVFAKFRQVGDARTRPPGTGLGLPISREIINNWGGRCGWILCRARAPALLSDCR